MRAACFVGRVGGLAVALGVGIAVTSTPGVAWADDTPSAPSGKSTGTAGSAGTNGASETPGTPATVGATARPAGTSTAAATETKGVSTPGSGSVGIFNPGTSASKAASVRRTDPGMVNATGGAQSSKKPSSDISAVDGEPAKVNTRASVPPKPDANTMAVNPEAPTAAGAPVGRPGNNQRPVAMSTGVRRVGANTVTGKVGVTPPLSTPAEPADTVLDVAVHESAAPRAVTALTATHPSPQRTAPVAREAISTAPEQPTPPRPEVTETALRLLASLAPLTTNGPLAPVDSPLELALAAVGTRARQFGQAVAEETRSQPDVESRLTSQNIHSEQTFAAVAITTSANSAPNVPDQPVGTPDPVTGVVTGTVIATDPDNNTLGYTMAALPTRGTVTLNAQTGAYTYTPTLAARLAAGATTLPDTDVFTVGVNDGQNTTTASVSVSVLPTRWENRAPIAVGTNPSAVAVSSDGRTYVANTDSNTVSVINTATGQRIDANPSNIFSTDISVGSSPSALAVSADGKRLYVANTGSGTVSVINTTNFQRIDANPSNIFSTDISVGSSPSALALGTDGRVYVANRGSNTVSVIDTVTNTLVDTNPNATGTNPISVGTSPSALALGADGRLYVANTGSGTVSVINTDSYSITNPITVGSQPAGLALGADGRLYVANRASNSVSVINTVTNTLVDTNPNAVGVNAISVGTSPSSVALSPDALAYVANGDDTVSVIDPTTYTVISTVAIDSDTTGGHVIAVTPNGTVYVTDAVDRTVRVLAVNRGAATGIGTGVSLLGNSVSLTGDTVARPVLTADGTRAVMVTPVTNGTTKTTRVAVINTATGQQAGTTLTLTGGAVSTVLSADGTRALVTTSVPNTTTGIETSRVTVINTATGALIGTTLAVSGKLNNTLLVGADDSRAVIITDAYDVYDWNPPVTHTTGVTVINTATGAQIGTTITVAGSPTGTTLFGIDGSRALITTSVSDGTVETSHSAVIDTTTGQTTQLAGTDTTTGAQTGATLTVADEAGLIPLNADGTRALLTTTNGGSNQVVVIDPTTGTQTGTPLTITGEYLSVLLSADKSRAVITTIGPNPAAGGSYATRVAVMNTVTGTQTGTTVTLPGEATNAPYVELTADGSRAVIVTPVYRPGGNSIDKDLRVAVINIADGTQIGTVLSLPGALITGPPMLTAGGARALIVTDVFDGAKRTYSTRVAVVNTVTGIQTGATLTFAERITYAPVLLSANGTHALLSYSTSSIFGSTTRLVVINTLTGAQTASLSVSGALSGQPLISADGTRVLITTATGTSSVTTRVQVLQIV